MVDPHVWIHEQVGITETQARALTPIEERYAAPKRQLVARIATANVELAQVMLADKESSALILTALEGWSHFEAAGRLGTTAKTIETRVYRARKRLVACYKM